VVDGTVLGSTVAIISARVAFVLLKPKDTASDSNPLESAVISSLLVFLVVLPSLVMLYGLTCDGGKSFTSRALQLPAAKWLGSISYSLYLSHAVIKAYVVFMLDSGDDSVECSGHKLTVFFMAHPPADSRGAPGGVAAVHVRGGAVQALSVLPWGRGPGAHGQWVGVGKLWQLCGRRHQAAKRQGERRREGDAVRKQPRLGRHERR
jgi:hypothetical protein